MTWNVFDFVLVFLAIVDQVLTAILQSEGSGNVSMNASPQCGVAKVTPIFDY